jgi:SAM-dependent methyltransferase
MYRGAGSSWWNPAWMAPVLPTLILVYVSVHNSRSTVDGTRLWARSFFGALTVRDAIDKKDPKLNQRHLINGRINHGAEWLDPMKRLQPLTYYGPKSGVGLAVSAIQARGPVKIGVVGLGTGTMAGFGRRGDTVRFYEINPIVPRIARSQFNFVPGTPATVDIVMGDARLSMEREPPQNYDLMVIDAFTSDSIPIHLLTQEAFRLYYRHLKPDGVLAVHISNRYLDLKPVCFSAAQALGKQARLFDPELDGTPGIWRSVWVLMPASADFFNLTPFKGQGTPLEAQAGFRAWTDDYSNLYQILYRY